MATCWLSCLPQGTQESELRDLLAKECSPTQVQVTGKKGSMATVSFANADAADECVTKFHGFKIGKGAMCVTSKPQATGGTARPKFGEERKRERQAEADAPGGEKKSRGGGGQENDDDNLAGGSTAAEREQKAAEELSVRGVPFSSFKPAEEEKERKDKVEEVTRLIGRFAPQKQLSKAVATFKKMVSAKEEGGDGLTPTAYTYSNLINNYVMGGDMAEAEDVFRRIGQSGEHPGLQISPHTYLIIYTTLLKGMLQLFLFALTALPVCPETAPPVVRPALKYALCFRA